MRPTPPVLGTHPENTLETGNSPVAPLHTWSISVSVQEALHITYTHSNNININNNNDDNDNKNTCVIIWDHMYSDDIPYTWGTYSVYHPRCSFGTGPRLPKAKAEVCWVNPWMGSLVTSYGVSINGVSKMGGWFHGKNMRKSHLQMDDLGVPLFQDTSICGDIDSQGGSSSILTSIDRTGDAC